MPSLSLAFRPKNLTVARQKPRQKMSEVVFTNMDDFLARYGTDEEKKAAQTRLTTTITTKEEYPAANNIIPEIRHDMASLELSSCLFH
jgi:hypothetical protein